MFHILHKREIYALKGAKLVILSGFFWRIDTVSLRQLMRPQATQAQFI